MMEKKQIEVCFSPALLNTFDITTKDVILVDILRATSAIVTAFAYGVNEIIPVAFESEAKEYKNAGVVVAGERDGVVLDFADFGNSPFNFMNDAVKGATIAYCTTNGTKAIKLASESKHLYIGAYLNISALATKLSEYDNDVIIFCSGWKNKFNLEDTLFAGALAEKLIDSGNFSTICDSTIASVDLWKIAKTNLLQYIEKAAHRHRLKKLGLDDVLEYCHTFDTTKIIPGLTPTGTIKAV